MTFKPGFHTGA